MKKIRLVIADDHSVVLSGLRRLLKSAPEFSVVAEASSGEEAIAAIEKHKPDIVMLDISMPGTNGIEATKIIRKNHPGTKILILTIHESEEYIYQMVQAGASGYLLKDAGRKELLAGVRAVAAGDRFFSPRVSKMMMEKFIERAQEEKRVVGDTPLTKRETEILRLIAQGLKSSQIAEKLFLSVRTVNTHRTNLMQKLDIHDRAGLVRYAIEKGIVSVNFTQ